MSTISRKNQVTIPADVLREAGLGPGDDVRIAKVGPGHIELVKTDALIDQYAGSLSADVYPPGYLDEVREGWR
ncbi:MAG TPA: AbrB/MazE/SpoVT family DNA-binding domain-containing protein [Solirubrobacteraceae bacterium]|nr:AbrB/MazE/SpoVT family DNA-binding domain-containing protein [Solirubrobacteraceae bacterium]